MKILMVSDTHDVMSHIAKLFDQVDMTAIDAIIHAGDLADVATMQPFIDTGKPMYYAIGNNEPDAEQTFHELSAKGVHCYLDVGEFSLGGKHFAITHYPRIAEKLMQLTSADIVVFGHSHRHGAEKHGKRWLVNPGNLAGWREEAYYAIYDTKEHTVTHHKLEVHKRHYRFT